MEKQSYRPVSRPVNIGSREYAVLDPAIAKERANKYLDCAKKIIHEVEKGSSDSESADNLTKSLLTATDYGCAESPFILAHLILDQKIPLKFQQEDAILFLKVAAERRHPEACRQMASCYAGKNEFQKIIDAGKKYFAEINEKDSQFLAEYYFEQAEKTEA